MEKLFVKVKEATKLSGIGKYTLYNAIKRGELQVYKPNCRDFLIKVTELEEWIKSKQVVHDKGISGD
ncbi:UNVERIFIED_CONTAM: excisionase family DNA binding protein [Acetivibrio alkalicellulosi]